MDVVFAKGTHLVAHPRHGGVATIENGTHWLAEDPLVINYPDLFTDDVRHALKTSEPLEDDGYPAFATRPSEDPEPPEEPVKQEPAGDPQQLQPVEPDKADKDNADSETRSTSTATETADATPGTRRRRQRTTPAKKAAASKDGDAR